MNFFGFRRSAQTDVRGLRLRLVGIQVLLSQEIRDDAEHDGRLVITALLHRLLHPFRGQVGVDEVGLLVVHDFKLMFQPQEKLHALLEHGDRVVALLLSAPFGGLLPSGATSS